MDVKRQEKRIFKIPLRKSSGETITLSHVGLKEQNQQYQESIVRVGKGNNWKEIQSQKRYIQASEPMMKKHIHGWEGFSEDGASLPFSPENLDFILDQYGNAPLHPEAIKEIRETMRKAEAKEEKGDEEEDKKIDLTPTTLYTWIRWIQQNRYAFDLNFENLPPTAAIG